MLEETGHSIFLATNASEARKRLEEQDIRRLEIQRLQTELQFNAQGHVNAVEKEIGIDFDALRSLTLFFKSPQVVSRDAFRTLTKDILQYTPSYGFLLSCAPSGMSTKEPPGWTDSGIFRSPHVGTREN
jgi:hypothetical protein